MAGKDIMIVDEVTINYIKTQNYRSFHVDGIFGGITPAGNIYVEPFTERSVTPRKIRHKVANNGALGEEIEREGLEGIIRQIECGLVLTLDAAISLRNWLDDKIEDTRKIQAANKEVKNG